jgi:hypothetical protein
MFKTVSEETKLFRLAICNSCEDLKPTVSICKHCGCYMPAKATFAEAFCPVKRWGQTEPGQSLINTIEEKILETWNKL